MTQVQKKFISHAKPYAYDAGSRDGNRWDAGTSYRVGVWSGNPDELPDVVKLKDASVDNRVRELRLKPLEDVVITFETDIRNGRPYIGKVVAIDRVRELAGKAA